MRTALRVYRLYRVLPNWICPNLDLGHYKLLTVQLDKNIMIG